MQSWFERVVLGYYTSKNEFGNKKIAEKIKFGLTGIEQVDNLTKRLQVSIDGKVLSKGDKVQQQMYESVKKQLEDMLPQSDEKTKVIIEKKIQEINADIEKLGKYVTVSSVTDALFNFLRFIGLGYNLSSSVTNYLEGQISNAMIAATGRYFTPGNIYRANSITRKARARLLGKKNKFIDPEVKKLSILMDRYRVLQDASNELQKASRKTMFSRFEKLSPYELVRSVEFVNQSPIFISVMLDTKITGKDGTVTNVFDAMDENGMLLDNYRTDENISNWENTKGNNYAKTKNHIVKTIVDTHGDYDELRGIMASETISGKAALMFKRWFPRNFYTKFAVEQPDLELGKIVKGRYRSHTQVTAGVHGAIIGTLLAGPLGTLVGGAAGTVAGRLFGVNSELSYAKELSIVGKELILNFLRTPINSLTGKDTIKDVDMGAYERSGVKEVDIENIRGNLMDMTIQLSLIALLLFTKALLWDDDDDEDSPRRLAHNLLANRFMTLSSQASMYSNPVELYKFATNISAIRFFENVGKTINEANDFLEGDDILQSGPHAGESALYNQVRKTFMPGILKQGVGFGSSMERQFVPSVFDDWFYGEEKNAQQKTKRIRAEKRADLKDDYEDLSDKEIEEFLNEEFRKKKPNETYQELLEEYEE